MDSFELNKIMGAVLGTLLFVMGAGFVAEAIYHPIEGRGPGYALPEPEVAEAGAPVEEVAAVSIASLLPAASAERGQAAVRKCQSCHNFGEGEPNKQGPHLYDVVERPEGSVPDFAYSEALLAHNAAGDIWTYDNLNAFLTKPSDYAPGTKMAFAGIRTAEERADILAYLQTLSASPKPFPEPEAAAPAEAEATTTPPADAQTPADNTTVPADAIAPETDPAAGSATPVTVTPANEQTQSDTPVQGTPTTSGTGPAATQPPAEPTSTPPANQAPGSAPVASPTADPAAPPAAAAPAEPAATETEAAPAAATPAPAETAPTEATPAATETAPATTAAPAAEEPAPRPRGPNTLMPPG